MDKYRSYDQLKDSERRGVDYRIHHSEVGSSNIAVVAPHGGGIEPGTMEIAVAVADVEYSLYVFEGIKKTNNADLHITSENFDEPVCEEIVRESQTVVAIHGYRGDDPVVYIGGLNRRLGKCVKVALREVGFHAAEPPTPRLQGRNPRNICNRGQSGQGLQLEISRGLRRRMFNNLTRRGRQHTTTTFDQFVSALRRGLAEYDRTCCHAPA